MVMLLTKEQVCTFLVNYHHLTPKRQLTQNELIAYIKKVGCIQYDPLDVVGRNADLVLQSRCPTYKKGDVEYYLYEKRELFDVWDKNMSICSIEDWPYFSRYRKDFLQWCIQYESAISEIKAYLKINKFACSSDFSMENKVDWHYGPQRLAKAALECMCYAGMAIVHHKKGTRRYYSLAEDYVPNDLMHRKDPNEKDIDYNEWIVLRRINSVGVLWNKSSDAWLGLKNFKKEDRLAGFAGLLAKNKIVMLQVEGCKEPLYLAEENINLLEEVLGEMVQSKEAYILAPLDNMLWDRKLISELFNFKYKWEVYTPITQRKYGYYVLPILCGHKLIARIEMVTNKNLKTLHIKNFWWEEMIKPTKTYKKQIGKCLDRFAKYNLCTSIIIDAEI